MNKIQEVILHALEKLGGEADITELRFQTMFKYKGITIRSALTPLRKKGIVTYIYDKRGGYQKGYWKLL